MKYYKVLLIDKTGREAEFTLRLDNKLIELYQPVSKIWVPIRGLAKENRIRVIKAILGTNKYLEVVNAANNGLYDNR